MSAESESGRAGSGPKNRSADANTIDANVATTEPPPTMSQCQSSMPRWKKWRQDCADSARTRVITLLARPAS